MVVSAGVLSVDGGKWIIRCQLDCLAKVPGAFSHIVELYMNELDYFLIPFIDSQSLECEVDSSETNYMPTVF